MESKPNACCANCERWDDKRSCVILYGASGGILSVHPDDFCSSYQGPGLTPQMEIDEKNKRIAELEAELDRNTSNLTRRAADLKVQLERAEEEVNNLKADRDVALEYINKPYPAPVAKPIVWGVEKYSDELSFEFEQSAYATFFQIHCFFRNEVLLGAWFAESKEAVVLKAQDWLNKLVAECASYSKNSNNSTLQFTTDDIYRIRKLAKLSGLMIANPIIAKCDALLEGAQG